MSPIWRSCTRSPSATPCWLEPEGEPTAQFLSLVFDTVEHMFENSDRSIDAMESRLLELETMVSRLRSEQLTILAELDVAQVAALDGSRSLVE